METFAPSRAIRPGNLGGLDCCISAARIDPGHTSGSDRTTGHHSNRTTGHRSNSRIGRNTVHARWRLMRSQAIHTQLPRQRAKQKFFSSWLLRCPASFLSGDCSLTVQCSPGFSQLGNGVRFSQKLYCAISDNCVQHQAPASARLSVNEPNSCAAVGGTRRSCHDGSIGRELRTINQGLKDPGFLTLHRSEGQDRVIGRQPAAPRYKADAGRRQAFVARKENGPTSRGHFP